MPRTIDNVLLDIDGTLLDINSARARAWREALQKHQIAAPLSRVNLLVGMEPEKLLAHMAGGSIPAHDAKTIVHEQEQVFRELFFPNVKVFPGVREFALALHTAGLRVVLTTSSPESYLEPIRGMLGIDDFIFGTATASDAARFHTGTDVLDAALCKYSFDRNRTAVICDTLYDIQIARRIPCQCIALRSGGFPANMLQLANEVYEDIRELTRVLPASLLLK